MKDFMLGLSLYPIWKWLHQNTCPHRVVGQWGMGFFHNRCINCGKYWNKKLDWNNRDQHN